MNEYTFQDSSLLELLQGKLTSDQGEKALAEGYTLDAINASKLTRSSIKRTGWRTTLFNDPYYLSLAAQPYKRYEEASTVDLSKHISSRRHLLPNKSTSSKLANKKLLDICRQRKSVKTYRSTGLSISDIATWLHYSYGIMRVEKVHEAKIPWKHHPIPSPGGLFGSEIYLLVLNGALDPGLYHFRPDTNQLECLKTGDFRTFVADSCGVIPYIEHETISCVLFSAIVVERFHLKYDDRALKFMFIETGILAQQLTVVAEALNIGTCMLGGYYDDDVNAFLELDGIRESVQNVMVVGYKK